MTKTALIGLCFILIGGLVVSGPSLATPAMDTDRYAEERARFLSAESALSRGDRALFRTLSRGLRDYPLAPDLAIEAVIRRLATAEPQEVEALLGAQAGTGPGERLRRLWLARLAREQRWEDYVRLYVDNGSETRECLYRHALVQTQSAEKAFAGIESLYLTSVSLPDVCDPLFAAAADSGALDPALVWRRIEAALQRGQRKVAGFQARYLPEAERPWLAFRLAAADSTQPFPSPPVGRHPRRAAVIAAALADLAERDPVRALDRLRTRHHELPDDQAGLVHVAAGLALAERGEADAALDHLDAPLPAAADLKLQLERLRAGLRLQAWEHLPAWIQALPEDSRHQAQWQYWSGRAMEQIGGHVDEHAAAAYRRAADDRSLWGFLAAERLEIPIKIDHRPVPVSDERLNQLLASPRAARLRELAALGREVEIRREWREYRRAIERALDGAARLSALQEAAALAQALGSHTQAIFILARSGYWDDLELRFPVLYADLVSQAAAETGVSEAWLFGVIRQESVFNPSVASSAGAVGLMQLLPSTAREVAHRHGIAQPGIDDLTEPALNIRLGSRYLASLYRAFDGQAAVATAAYNAGPGAVRRWLPDAPMPADLWIATIPYSETRDYVARVLAYQLLYAHRLGQQIPVLSTILTPVGKP